MVYLINRPGPQAVMIPKPFAAPSGTMKLTLRNTVNQTEPVDATVIDIAVSRLYYFVAITVPEGMQQGEYEYTLYAGGVIAATGIAVLREEVAPVEYDNPIEYEQYETS